LVEPVAQGTNRAAVESSAVDILAHPGLLSPDETRIAAERECYVELTTRKGHSLANGHVARVCLESGAPLIVNSDAHEPSDLPTLSFAQRVAEGAGLSPQQVSEATLTNPRRLLARVLDSRKTWV